MDKLRLGHGQAQDRSEDWPLLVKESELLCVFILLEAQTTMIHYSFLNMNNDLQQVKLIVRQSQNKASVHNKYHYHESLPLAIYTFVILGFISTFFLLVSGRA
jgi:hypothetical protein